MKRRRIFLLALLISLVSFNVFGQRIPAVGLSNNSVNESQNLVCEGDECEEVDINEALQERISATICNQQWLVEVAVEDLRAEVARYQHFPVDSFWNRLFSSHVQLGLKNFISDNNPCDFETGDTPMRLAFYGDGADSDVIFFLYRLGAELPTLTPDVLSEVALAKYRRIERMQGFGRR